MRGYRSNEDWPEQSARTAEGRSSTPLFIGTVFVAVFLFFDCLEWVFNRGGIISVLGVLGSVQAKSASIDVDQNGLSLAAIVLLCALVVGACRVLGVKSISHGRTRLIIVGLIAALLAFDFGPENGLIARYMAAHGYRHCASRDHTAGSGKGAVWFDNYTRNSAYCPPSR